MKRPLIILLACVLFAGQAPADTPGDTYAGKLLDAEKKFSEFLPKLQALGGKHSSDIEIQLGLASLYSSYGPPINYSSQEQYQRVLAIVPNNKVALANSARLICRSFTAKRKSLLEELEGVINNAKERGVKELTVPRYSQLYQRFEGKDKNRDVFKDFYTPVRLLQVKIDQELPVVLAILNNAENKDPNNALYNYLRADLYFELGNKDKAISEVKIAVVKPYWNNYSIEVSNAVRKVLQEVEFPEVQRSVIEDSHPVHSDFLRGKIWKSQLEPLGNFYDAQGDLKKAEEMYILVVGMAKQIKEEPIPYDFGTNQRIGQILENKALQHIEELHKKMVEN